MKKSFGLLIFSASMVMSDVLVTGELDEDDVIIRSTAFFMSSKNITIDKYKS